MAVDVAELAGPMAVLAVGFGCGVGVGGIGEMPGSSDELMKTIDGVDASRESRAMRPADVQGVLLLETGMAVPEAVKELGAVDAGVKLDELPSSPRGSLPQLTSSSRNGRCATIAVISSRWCSSASRQRCAASITRASQPRVASLGHVAIVFAASCDEMNSQMPGVG